MVEAGLQSEAFQRLYPQDFYARFIAEGVRPDGRPLGRPRPVSIGLNSIKTANSSALVKIGNATALACIKLETMQPTEAAPAQGQVLTTVELTPMCSPHTRPGRPSPTAQVLSQHVGSLVDRLVDAQQLGIAAGKAAWAAYLDIYVLDADGSLFDVTLLAAVAALRCLAIPRAALSEAGAVVLAAEAAPAGDGDGAAEAAAAQEADRHLTLGSTVVALTCGFHGTSCIVDPSASEEPLLGSTLTVVLDDAGSLLGMQKLGGAALDSTAQLQTCIAHARLRHREVAGLLQQALDAAGVPPAPEAEAATAMCL